MSSRRNRVDRNVPRRSLARVMSKQGLCSRSAAEKLARDGNVKVNGKIVRSPEALIPLDATIELLNKTASPLPTKTPRYAVMNKRRGVVTTAADELGRSTVYDDLQKFLDEKNITERLFAVGRLDKDTEGLLLFTNDNEFADWLTSPDNSVPKTYLAKLTQPCSDEAFKKLQEGVAIEVRGEHYVAKPTCVRKIAPALIELVLTEGKNREVRRLFKALGYSVKSLVRTGVAGLRLDLSAEPPTLDGMPLPSGNTREIQKAQLLRLNR